jgi:hypothetical protein
VRSGRHDGQLKLDARSFAPPTRSRMTEGCHEQLQSRGCDNHTSPIAARRSGGVERLLGCFVGVPRGVQKRISAGARAEQREAKCKIPKCAGSCLDDHVVYRTIGFDRLPPLSPPLCNGPVGPR